LIKKEISLGDKTLSIETGKMARQANGSVVVKYGDSMVLVTACAQLGEKSDRGYFPLMCDYRERGYASGQIPGGFFKREGRPSSAEILASRLIDRPIRPLFPDGFMSETQIIATLISSDKQNPGDVLGMVGASAALSISDIPFQGPIAGVCVGRIDDEFIINPTYDQREESELEIIVAGNEDSVVMVEGEAMEISEDLLVDAIEFGQEAIVKLIELQKELVKEIQPEKFEFEPEEENEEFKNLIAEKTIEQLDEFRRLGKENKNTRKEAISDFIDKLTEELEEEYPDDVENISDIVDELIKKDVRKDIIENQSRLDGRALTDIREISCEVGLLPKAHGSALFTRGETQSLGSVTLGTKFDEQIIDEFSQEEYRKKFTLHYNFPPFSVGEVSYLRGPGRREIGHGNLAERALKKLMPDEEDFPYTTRIVSDILESNGSSSMASVCSGSMALMDAGVPLEKAVAGIAMGMVKDGDDAYILTDILGVEDHFGDMDFKVTGTVSGITAIQMDLKVKGISAELMRKALAQAKAGRLFILDKMTSTIKKHRPELSPEAPCIVTTRVETDKIGDVIGPGGKNIQKIQEETEAEISIEDDGTVLIYADSQDAGYRAKAMVEKVAEEPEEGKVYRDCPVKRLEKYGAFVEFLPGTTGLLHISEVEHKHTKNIHDVLSVGDKVDVLLKKISSPGKYELSIKALKDKK
jgi:polyribonucleotide nucleotidyltransferase